MTHLSESELVDFVEDSLDPRRAAHLETCATCREQGEGLRRVWSDTALVDVPEPSPLFWTHFAARVRDDVTAAPAPRASIWAWTGIHALVPLASAVALIIAVVSGVLLVQAVRDGGSRPAVSMGRTAAAADVPAAGGIPDANNAEVWDVLTAAASTVPFEEAHDAGLHVRPGTIDHAVQDLSAAELTELGRLLQSEMKRASN